MSLTDVANKAANNATPNNANAEANHPVSPGVAKVRDLLGKGVSDPSTLANVLRSDRADEADILAELHQSLGNAQVLQIVDAANAKPVEVGNHPLGKQRVTAEHGLRVRSSPDTTSHENVVDHLHNNDTVTAKTQVGDWLEVEHGNGTAFVHGHYVVPVTPKVASNNDVKVAKPVSQVAPAEATPAPVLPKPVVNQSMTVLELPAIAPVIVQNAQNPAPLANANANANAQPAPAPKLARDSRGGNVLTDTTYLQSYHDATGHQLLDSTDEEATTLNNMRKSSKKFHPAYLLALQKALGVANQSGAFNTETLRKLRDHHKNPTLGVSQIEQGDVLTSIVKETLDENQKMVGPFVDVGSGFGGARKGSLGRVPQGMKKSEGLAHAAGYASWNDMHSAMVPMELLGKSLSVGLPHIAKKVELADKWLRQRHKLDKSDPKKATWEAYAKNVLQWNYTGTGAYHHNANDIGLDDIAHGMGPHLHSAGLALDIDKTHNPWVFTGTANEANTIHGNHIRWAAQIYGGEELTATTMMHWAETMSTEEMWARVDKVNESFRQYLKLGAEGTDDEVINAFVDKGGFTKAEARERLPKIRRYAKQGDAITQNKRYWQDNMSRAEATKLTTHSLDIVIALRDVAGLAWGGVEMSGNENGDFMHFDCRNEDVGKRVRDFSLANHGFTDESNGA